MGFSFEETVATSSLFPVALEDLCAQLRELGVQRGGILLVHVSYRSVRPVEGGPAGLIRALREALGPTGTLVAPCWTGNDDDPFDPNLTPASPDLGVTSETFRLTPGVERSEHPFAFAAVGPRAREIVHGPLPLPPHAPNSPVGRVRDLDGSALLLGVGHEANTTLHLAEVEAGVPYGVPRHITVLEGVGPRRIDYRENDHCCELFALADGWLRDAGLQAEGRVGQAHARLARCRDIARVAHERLARDPLLFLHPRGAGCAECDAAHEGITAGCDNTSPAP